MNPTVSLAPLTSRSGPPTVEQRKKIVGLAAEGLSMIQISKSVGVTEYYVKRTIEAAGISYETIARIRKLKRLQEEINKINKTNIQVMV